MQNSIVRFPAPAKAPRTVIDPRKSAKAPATKVARIGVSRSMIDHITYPSYVACVEHGDHAANSMQRMDAVYERVTAFLQKIKDEDFRV